MANVMMVQESKPFFTAHLRNIVLAFLAGVLIGYGWGNGHTTQNAIQDVAQKNGQQQATINKLVQHDIPKLKAQAGCEHVRADVATEAVISRISGDAADIPDCPPMATVSNLGKVIPSVIAPK